MLFRIRIQVINAGFSHGWTNDWFGYGADSDPGNPNPAVIQTTALHEVGHTLGLHHVFTLPAYGDSFSTMNYTVANAIYIFYFF